MRTATKRVATWLGMLVGIVGLEHGYFEALQGNSVSWYTNTLLGALSRLASSLPVLCSQTYSKATAHGGIVTNALVCGFFIPVLGKGRSHMQLDAFSAKTVVITGASSGIGEALALRLADEGAWLALATRAAPRLVAVAAACRQRGGQAIAIPPTSRSSRCARIRASKIWP